METDGHSRRLLKQQSSICSLAPSEDTVGGDTCLASLGPSQSSAASLGEIEAEHESEADFAELIFAKSPRKQPARSTRESRLAAEAAAAATVHLRPEKGALKKMVVRRPAAASRAAPRATSRAFGKMILRLCTKKSYIVLDHGEKTPLLVEATKGDHQDTMLKLWDIAQNAPQKMTKEQIVAQRKQMEEAAGLTSRASRASTPQPAPVDCEGVALVHLWNQDSDDESLSFEPGQ